MVLNGAKRETLQRLSELSSEHSAALADGGGFIQNEQATRKSYRLVLKEALEAGVLTVADLAASGFPERLE